MKNWIMKQYVRKIVKNEKGQGMAEYGLIIALIAVVVITILTTVGNNLVSKFTDIANAL